MSQAKIPYKFTYRQYAEALYSALVDDDFYITLEQSVRDPSTSKEALLKYLDYSMVEGQNYGETYIPPGHSYGVSVWSKPLAQDQEAEKKNLKLQFIRAHLGESCEQKYRAISQSMSNRSTSLVSDDSWYLSIVGVLPEFQNQGLGVELIRNVLETTDKLGVSTYLETFTPRNESFYARLGYQVAGSFHEPTIGSNYSLMIRV